MEISRKTFHVVGGQKILVRACGHVLQIKYTLAESCPTWIYQKEVQTGGNSQKQEKREYYGKYFQRDKHGIRRRTCWGLSFRISTLQHIIQWIPFSLATQIIPIQIRAMGSSHFCLGQKVNIFYYFGEEKGTVIYQFWHLPCTLAV